MHEYYCLSAAIHAYHKFDYLPFRITVCYSYLITHLLPYSTFVVCLVLADTQIPVRVYLKGFTNHGYKRFGCPLTNTLSDF